MSETNNERSCLSTHSEYTHEAKMMIGVDVRDEDNTEVLKLWRHSRHI